MTGASYQPFGPLTTLTFAGGRTLSKVYDADYQIDRIDANGSTKWDFGSDVLGNITRLTDSSLSPAVGRTLEYDGQNRLKALKSGSTVVQGFTYDATGNRLSAAQGAATTSYTYPNTSHRLDSVGSTPRSYDNAGNTTQIGSANNTAQKFTYNDHGRLSTVKVGSKVKLTNKYNGRGERVIKLAERAADNRYFAHALDGKLLGEYTSTGARIAEYVWLDDTLVAILSDHDGSAYQYVETDHLGTPRAVVHPQQNTIIWRWELTTTAFGEHAPNQDPDGNGKAYVLNLRYPGQYFDAESGLHYNYYRDGYDPGTGRYTQPDPIGINGGFGLYSYVDNQPVTYVDPTGLIKWTGNFAVGRLSLSKKLGVPS